MSPETTPASDKPGSWVMNSEIGVTRINYDYYAEQEKLLDATFCYQAPDTAQVRAYKEIREAAKHLVRTILRLAPPSPDRRHAIRKVREAVMMANASIALGGRAVE